jgi:hypothetical protein
VPRTSLLAHPIYLNSGEIPGIDPVYGYWADDGGGGLELRSTASLSSALNDVDAINPGVVFLRSYTPAKRGNLGRTPDILTLDLHGDYPLAVGKTQMRLFMDVFNVFDQKPVTQYVDTVEMSSGVTDPNYGRASAYVAPRTVRFGLRWDF